MANKITALITHYYPERLHHVKRIVNDLKNSSRPPDKIIVFNNDPKVRIGEHVQDDSVISIDSSVNFFGRSKFIACLLEPSDFYLLLDNDMTVGKETISHLESIIPENIESFCTAQQGVIFGDGLFSERLTVSEFEIDKPTKTETIIGSFIFCSFSAIVRMLTVEPKIILENKEYKNLVGDDILMGLINNPITIYPARGEECAIDLPQEGVACFKQYPEREFSKKRDAYAIMLRNKLKR